MAIADTDPPRDEGFIEKLKALAAGFDVVKVLVNHKPNPVPVSVISEELGVKRSTASMHLGRLRRANLVGLAGRNEGYFAQTAQVRAVVGAENYTRITQGFGLRQNGDTPGLP